MAYERYPRGNDPQRGSYGRDDVSDYGQDYGATEDRYTYSSARDYRAAGAFDRGRDDARSDYGGEQRYGARAQSGWGGGWGADRDEGRTPRFGDSDRYRGALGNYGQDDRQGSQRYVQGGQDQGRDPYRQARGTYDRQPQRHGNNPDDRGFLARAGDEVRSWFGDEEAEHRREADARRDEQASRGNYGRDEHYHHWRSQQIAAFDRDYDEYRRENQSRFHNEFSSWRTDRQGQRDLLGKVEEHATVVGSDGEHVGTVDKVRGDRIILTKNDADAGGRHHSVPYSWLQSADSGTVTLRKTAAEAKAHWRDEERQESSGAMFGGNDDRQSNEGGTNLNRSFSGTY